MLDASFEGPVVTDIRMPRMSGLQLFERIKALDPELPVLLVTGHADVDLAVAALKDGAYDFISKPFDGERLATAVAHVNPARITTCVVQGGIGNVGGASVVLPFTSQARRLGDRARTDATLESCA